jgi:Family of unknown function (DUF5684)
MGFLSNFAQEAVPTVTSVDITTTTVETSGGFWAAMGALWVVYFIVVVLAIIAYWKIFTKAGEAGWQSIIPIWSTIVLLKIVGRPVWWILLLLIPFVNIVVIIVVMLDLAKSFGKSTAFGIFGLVIFSLIGYFILGFGDAKYVGPGGAAATPAAPAPVA